MNVDALGADVLAYVGDAAYELAVRTHLAERHDAKARALHRMAVARVNAASQARAALALLPELTEGERAVFARGKNVKHEQIPRSATREQYQLATAFEAVLGRHALAGDTERLAELCRMALALPAQDAPCARAFKRAPLHRAPAGGNE